MEDPAQRPSPPPPAEAEMRPVTVLKCDVVGSTAVNTALTDSGRRAFQNGWDFLVGGLADLYSGEVERFEGDGAFVSFGYRNANEDAAECAVRMALHLVEQLPAARFVPGHELRVRIGIASGPVGVDLHPAHRRSEPLFGNVIVLAERLKDAAMPNEILISDVTKRLAGRFFHYNDLGRMYLKGLGEGHVAWRVIRASSINSRFEAQRSPDVPIVGRDLEIRQLEDAWSQAAQGRGVAVCLEGDAGLGKSRLARRILDTASADQAVILEIDCTPSTRNSPLYPIGVLLRRLAGVPRGASAERTEALAADFLDRYLRGEGRTALSCLAPLFGLPSRAKPGENPAEGRARTVAAMIAMVADLAREGPVVLLCEDLHWADDTTAQVIEQFRAGVQGLRLLLLVTTRPRGPDDSSAAEVSGFAKIELRPLDDARARGMVSAMAAPDRLDDVAIASIVARCEGVPLVLEELTRSELEGKAPDAPGTRDVPGTLDLVVHSRLARRPYLLPIVQRAAVLGREFSLRLLERMLPADTRAGLSDAISVLVSDGLLAPSDSGDEDRMQFKHAMIREAVHKRLLDDAARELHAFAASTRHEEASGTPDAAPDLIAEHLRLAGRFEQAIGMRLAAMMETAARGAYVEAEGHYAAARELLARVGDANQRRTLEMQLHLQLGVAFSGRYGYASREAEAQFREAQRLCRDDDDIGLRYRISRGLAALEIVRGHLPAAFRLSGHALEIAEESGRPEFRIDALSVHCYANMYYGTLEDTHECIDRCMALYRAEDGMRLSYPVPNDAGIAALAIKPTIEWLRGDTDACEAAIGSLLAHAEALDRDFDRAYAHGWVAGVRCTQRRFAEALQHATVAAEIGQRRLYLEWQMTGTLLQLVAAASLHPTPETLQNAFTLCQEFAKAGVGLNGSWYLWGLARGYQKLGVHEAAAQLADQGFALARASGESRMHPELLMLKAQLEPDRAKAAEHLGQALDVAIAQEAVANALRAAAMLVLATPAASASAERARASLELLDGATPYPPGPWMHERLTELRYALQASPARLPA